jgi:hypothetical protein
MVYANSSEDYIKKAILKTIIYSDIFNFPLTKNELWKFLSCEKKVLFRNFQNVLERSQKGAISVKDGYFFLKGRENIVEKRKKNITEAERNLQIAKKAVKYLSFIPTLLFIGISGGVAMGDVEKKDDIDFFVITKKNALFKTRFFILLILFITGLKRRRGVKYAPDKICINYLIDETAVAFPQSRHELYTAHEIAQVIPLFDREDTYRFFLEKNKWIKRFLPNAFSQKNSTVYNYPKSSGKYVSFLINFLAPEWMLRLVQINFMKAHLSGETISKSVLAFNPYDYRVQTLRNLRLRYQKLGLLTKG